MSAAAPLDLGPLFTPKATKKRKSAAEEMCRCGCELALHAGRKHRGPCSRCGGCKRGRPKKKPPVEQPAHLAAPNGAIVLERDDTKRAKAMGWATLTSSPALVVVSPGQTPPPPWDAATIYLAQLKTKSLNAGFFGAKKGDEEKAFGKMLRRRYAWQANYKDACRERAASAIAQLGTDVAARGRPVSIKVTRVSPGRLDAHDNLRGALKYVVDGIAEALGFNDAELADSASRAGTIPITYAQEKCPPKVCGVRIEITWRTT